MATLTSLVFSPAVKKRVFLTSTFRPQYSTFLHNQNRKISCNPTKKLVRAEFRVPEDAKARFNLVKEKVCQSVPDSAKNLEWKKAGEALQHQLFCLGEKVLIWWFITVFSLCVILESIYTISMNKELLMPLGLFAGCLMTDFVKETSLEFFGHSKAADLEWHLLGIGGFCALLKFISLLLPVPGRVLLAHVASGGLLQAFWIWRSSSKENVSVEEIELY